ncbi:phosphoribosylanthranilate isomerase [Asticcacaulis tiandongensis]|uniref:phosphoribosylanthranilate isomerase n=1 Tax=Asticcacaulis tiandongensis TaxID=2565365 RepID=UPI00112717C7|nr:phosphoribosylanthranilate isomerase [Asticcacaulis tiandongensis]
MTVLVKICGIVDDVIAHRAIDDSADMLGFVFFPKSPRHLPIDVARNVITNARAYTTAATVRPKMVSVMVNPDDSLLKLIIEALSPDVIQLHGHETPERVRDIHARFNTPLIKAISVSDASDVASAKAYEPYVDYLMFDAKPPAGAALPGGVGARFDWSLMQHYRGHKPWFLAGGLNPDNVSSAISLSKAPLVDVSSGVERAPGLKDPSLITQFINNAKQT